MSCGTAFELSAIPIHASCSPLAAVHTRLLPPLACRPFSRSGTFNATRPPTAPSRSGGQRCSTRLEIRACCRRQPLVCRPYLGGKHHQVALAMRKCSFAVSKCANKSVGRIRKVTRSFVLFNASFSSLVLSISSKGYHLYERTS
ncbi:hypothetical protein BD626DRAFT_483245 [Schizophyllum amplum]|uniref:Uncharacterized protein n=1 Tax=Schizophyllum amplum TaxID=97359 RepID=A0A550CP85_9AGAR|nr:hypothetical protein BD626DRAFT_483245 [Auriculariopsis ampla]